MFLLQTPWSVGTLDGADAALRQAIRTKTKAGPHLALLPHGDGGEHEAPSEADVIAALNELAKAHQVYLGASSYVVATGEVVTRTVGFLIDPEGQVLIRTPKILPDIVEGFTDTSADTFQPAVFQIAKTSLGQMGMMCGEDVLAPHVVR